MRERTAERAWAPTRHQVPVNRQGLPPGRVLPPVSGAVSCGAKEDKKQRRRKYEAFRVDDEDDDALPRGYVNPLSQTYGTDKDIAPARRRDDGWDPNQW